MDWKLSGSTKQFFTLPAVVRLVYQSPYINAYKTNHPKENLQNNKSLFYWRKIHLLPKCVGIEVFL